MDADQAKTLSPVQGFVPQGIRTYPLYQMAGEVAEVWGVDAISVFRSPRREPESRGRPDLASSIKWARQL